MSELTATGLIIGGEVAPCDLPVYNWHDHGLEFKPGDGGRAVKPKQIVDLAVWHWTGGEGDYRAVYRTLQHRELGVELYIADGNIYQYCDPLVVDAFGAGHYNPRSLSIEMKNYGFRKDMRQVPQAGRSRPIFETVQNGKRRTFARFHPEDLRAAAALAKALSAAIPSIPPTTPVDQSGAPYPNYIPPHRMRLVKGHVGHYHLSLRKADPGPELLQHLRESGAVSGEIYPQSK